MSLTSIFSAFTWSNIKSKDSFEILRTSRFQNWPYFLKLVKIWGSYCQKTKKEILRSTLYIDLDSLLCSNSSLCHMLWVCYKIERIIIMILLLLVILVINSGSHTTSGSAPRVVILILSWYHWRHHWASCLGSVSMIKPDQDHRHVVTTIFTISAILKYFQTFSYFLNIIGFLHSQNKQKFWLMKHIRW